MRLHGHPTAAGRIARLGRIVLQNLAYEVDERAHLRCAMQPRGNDRVKGKTLIRPAREEFDQPAAAQKMLAAKAVPMIATVDVGRLAAELIQQDWTGRRVVELEAEHRVTPDEVAATFAKLLGRSVEAQVVPRATWSSLFESQGMKYPQPRIRMLEGFNEGWIEFEGDGANVVKGSTGLETVLRGLVSQRA
jgi:hypothetical protein